MFWKMSCLHTFFICPNQFLHRISCPSAEFLVLFVIFFMSSLSQKVNTMPTLSALRFLMASNVLSKSYFYPMSGRTAGERQMLVLDVDGGRITATGH